MTQVERPNLAVGISAFRVQLFSVARLVEAMLKSTATTIAL
jgi:hypothetical protein